jgi:site-specific DNA-cytosine methylase
LGLNILSLFDGMSCGQIALNRMGIKYDKYFASEIDKHAIKVTMSNYPNTIQLGDITKITTDNLPKIDLICGGSPCQGFSFAGKGLNFNDPRSKLFFEFVRLVKECKPKYFLLENVNMVQSWQDIISEQLGVNPIYINSRLVSAQDRKRLYWTNIPVVGLPEDKNISFVDIVEDNWYCGSMRGRRIDPIKKTRSDYNKSIPLIQYIECRMDNKTNCLSTVSKDNVAVKNKAPRRRLDECEYRYLTPNEYEALQTVPKNYTSCVSDSQRRKMLGNGWTVDVIAFIFSFMK